MNEATWSPSARTTVDGRTRARGLGILFQGRPGPLNAVTDVPGVEIGFITLTAAGSTRTGVTALLPRGSAAATVPCAAGIHSMNGNGELTGSHWINESGATQSPIMLTNTHAVGACHRGTIEWIVERHPEAARRWHLPVVGETFDGYLNDINAPSVTVAHAKAALNSAAPGPFPLGSVGGGTGMNCYEFKGGTGTSSRLITLLGQDYTVGVLVQANFGAREELTVAGIPVGGHLRARNPMREDRSWLHGPGAGSVIVVVVTDAPLLPQQCAALARRVPLGLARTGTAGSHFSGDIFLALSSANFGALRSEPGGGRLELDRLSSLPWGHIDPLYTAVVQATEEAVIDSMVCSETTRGRDGHWTPGLPIDQLLAILRDHKRLA